MTNQSDTYGTRWTAGEDVEEAVVLEETFGTDASSSSDTPVIEVVAEQEPPSREAVLERLRQGNLFRFMEGIVKYMDQYYLDPLIGMFTGVGDILTAVTMFPFVYYSLFHVRSIPLTLAVICNALRDVVLGMIPFGIGTFFDIFYKSNRRNYNLIVGYVQGDEQVVRAVRQKALVSGLIIVALCVAIYFLAKWIVALGGWFFGLFG